MKDFLEYVIFAVGNFKVTIWSLVQLALIYLLTLVALRIIKRVFVGVAKKRNIDPGRQMSLFLLIKYVVWISSILFMLGAFGIKFTFLLASSAALLVGLGLGLQKVFEDVVCGIFILFEGTIELGDVLQVEGIIARVDRIGLRTSTVHTNDGVNLIIPNHKFVTENVTNWSHASMPTRYSVSVGVAYNTDPEKVRAVLLEATKDHPKVITDDERYRPSVRLVKFGDSSMDFQLLYWSYEQFWIEVVKSEVRFTIAKLFKENQITIPFPQWDLHIKSAEVEFWKP